MSQVGKHKAISHGDIGLLQRYEKRIYDAPVALRMDKEGRDRMNDKTKDKLGPA